MEDARADAWVLAQLRTAREALRSQPPGPGDLTLPELEAQLRGLAQAVLRPTAHYLDLTVESAQAAAAGSGDRLCVHRGTTGHRADWLPDRVHVEVDAQGRVRTAHRDAAPWTNAG